MKEFDTKNIDGMITRGEISIPKALPTASVEDLKVLYVQYNDYQTKKTTFTPISEMTSAQFGAFLRQNLNRVPYKKEWTELDRLEILGEMFSVGCVGGSNVHIWAFRDKVVSLG